MITTPAAHKPHDAPPEALHDQAATRAARALLRTLGQHLDRQVTSATSATAAELDATLSAMRTVHERIEASRQRTANQVTRRPA